METEARARSPPRAPPPLPPPPRRALRLDRVVGSQPELGPAAPDGGVGWVVVAASALLRVLLPTLALSYGAVVVRDAAAGDPPVALPPAGAASWNGQPLWVAALFSASWSFAAPWSRTLTTAKGARAACAIGVTLAASAELAAALLTASHSPAQTYMVGVAAGVLAGAGCCLSLSAADYLLRAYFRAQLLRAQALVRVAHATGAMLAPLALYAALERVGGWRAQAAQAALAAVGGLLATAALAPPRYGLSAPDRSSAAPPAAGYELLQESSGSSGARFKTSARGPGPRLDPDSDVELLPMVPSSSDEDEAPRPLFTDVDLRVGAATVFVDEEAADEEVVLFSLDSRPKGRYRLTDELRMLCRPMLYAALLAVATSRLSTLAYWLLAPAVAWHRAANLTDLQALGVVSMGGVVDFVFAWAWPWLRPLETKRKMRLLCGGCFFTAVGFFGFGSGAVERGLLWLLLSALLSRVGLAAAAALVRPLIFDALGADDFAHALSLLDFLTGLLVLLATLFVGPTYAKVFWALAWVNLVSILALAALFFGGIWRRRQGGR